MKTLFNTIIKTTSAALLGIALLASCSKDDYSVGPKPVVTKDMYSVSVNCTTGEVEFKFLEDAMTSFWTVEEPVGITTKFSGSDVVKAFKSNGTYRCTLIAYGKKGQSAPVSFDFVIEGFVPPMTDEELAAQNALSGKTMYVSAYGWWGEGWEWFEEPVEAYTADDRITFKADGTLTIDQGETAHIYNDCVAGGEDYTFEGTANWRIITEDDAVKVQFANGGFPLMLAGVGGADSVTGHLGLNDNWTVSSIKEDGTVRLDIYQTDGQYFAVFLSPVVD